MVSLEIKNEVAAQPQLKWTYGCTLNISNLSNRKVVILTHCLATKFLVIFKVTHFCLYKGKFFEPTLICEIFFQEIWLKAYEKGLFLKEDITGFTPFSQPTVPVLDSYHQSSTKD